MVIKWKKMCEKWCEIWWKRWILWEIFFVSCVLFFLGLGMAVSDGESFGEAFQYFGQSDYVDSPLHAQDVREAVQEVLEKSISNTYFAPDEWKFKGTYDYVLEKGTIMYNHKTNIPVGAYAEYLDNHREQFDEGMTEAGLKKKLADWYFRKNFSCYYVWNGDTYEQGGNTSGEVLGGLLGEEWDVKMGIGFSEEMLEEGNERLQTIQFHYYGGFLCMGLGALLAVFSLLVRLCGIRQRSQVHMYNDVMLFACVLSIVLLFQEIPRMIRSNYLDAGTGRMLLSVAPQAILQGMLAAIFAFALVHLLVNLCRDHLRKNNYFLFCAASYVKRRITGEAYYGEGILVCSRRRFQFSILLSIIGIAAITLVTSKVVGNGWTWLLSIFMSRWTVCILLLLVICFIAVILGIYEGGSRKLSQEYRRLQNQLEQIYHGNYQNHDMLPDSSVFAGESVRMSMLGCQMQENVKKQIQAEKMKMDLITNVSHDLKTPLTSIISYIDLLEKEELSPVAADYAKVLERKADHLRKMITDVFDLTKASSGNMEIRKDSVDFKMLLLQTLADMQQEVDRTPVKVVTDVPEHAVLLQSDGEKVYRILQNIMENALKYSMKDTRIYVSLSENAADAVLRIKNVASYEMNFTKEEVIGRFFRGDKARSTEGSGLGLAIAKEFTEACGGMFDVDVDGDVFCVEIRFAVRN